MRPIKLKTIFLIDGIGAVLTAFLNMAVLRTFNEYVGLPKEIFSILAIIAVFFAVYSFSCFLFSDNESYQLLKPIIIANLTYCILTLGLIFYDKNSLTILRVVYFIGEILVICGLVSLELKTLYSKS